MNLKLLAVGFRCLVLSCSPGDSDVSLRPSNHLGSYLLGLGLGLKVSTSHPCDVDVATALLMSPSQLFSYELNAFQQHTHFISSLLFFIYADISRFLEGGKSLNPQCY